MRDFWNQDIVVVWLIRGRRGRGEGVKGKRGSLSREMKRLGKKASMKRERKMRFDVKELVDGICRSAAIRVSVLGRSQGWSRRHRHRFEVFYSRLT